MVLNLQSQPNTLGIWQLKIIMQQALMRSPQPNLISKKTVLALQQEVVGILESHEEELKPNLQKYLRGEEFDVTLDMLAAYATFYDIPCNIPIGFGKKEIFEVSMYFKNHMLSVDVLSKVLKICE